jgi:hypothetical protein
VAPHQVEVQVKVKDSALSQRTYSWEVILRLIPNRLNQILELEPLQQ